MVLYGIETTTEVVTFFKIKITCQFQTENLVVRGNTLHHTDDHGPRGIQGKITQAGTLNVAAL